MKDKDMMRAVHQQAFEKWINPEVLARHARGEVEQLPMVLHTAQIVFGIDGSHKVRINEEAKGIFKGRALKNLKKGQALTYKDVGDLFFSEQAPEDKEFGHITLVSSGDDKWSVSFSFIYGTRNIEKYLRLGKEFLDQSAAALNDSKRVALTLGMTAAENLIKARLAASPLADIKTKKHDRLRHIYNSFVVQNQPNKLNKDYQAALKFFAKHFNKARYEPDATSVHLSTLKKHLRVLAKLQAETQRMIDQVEETSLASRKIRIGGSPQDLNKE
jgi:hypothetical protein